MTLVLELQKCLHVPEPQAYSYCWQLDIGQALTKPDSQVLGAPKLSDLLLLKADRSAAIADNKTFSMLGAAVSLNHSLWQAAAAVMRLLMSGITILGYSSVCRMTDQNAMVKCA